MSTLHRGHIFHLTGRPTVQEAADALVEIPDGGLLVDDDGVIEWCGRFADRPPLPETPVEVVDHGDAFILPGFVDTHMHYPQVNSIDAYGGGQLLEWLTECIFPAEARFENEEFAWGRQGSSAAGSSRQGPRHLSSSAPPSRSLRTPSSASTGAAACAA